MLLCNLGRWKVIEDNIQDSCSESPTVHISDDVPPGYGSIESRNSIIVDKESGDNESVWFTVTVIAVVACVAGLCVWLYLDRFGNKMSFILSTYILILTKEREQNDTKYLHKKKQHCLKN